MTHPNDPVLVGAHISIAGGVSAAFARGAEAGCAAMQIFTRNATQWRSTDLPPAEVARFRGRLDAWHDSTAVVVAIPR